MYAIIETGGKQYKGGSGRYCFHREAQRRSGRRDHLDKGSRSRRGRRHEVGAPCVGGATVTAWAPSRMARPKKITVFTYKPKKNEKRKMGHRQPYTKVGNRRYQRVSDDYGAVLFPGRASHGKTCSTATPAGAKKGKDLSARRFPLRFI